MLINKFIQMKYIFTLITILTLSFSSFAQNDAVQKIKGFRSLEWGQVIEEITVGGEEPNFIQTEKKKDGKYFVLAEENLALGNVLLTGIQYVFSKKDDKFYKVILTGKKEDVEQMNFIIDYKYGDNLNLDEKDGKVVKQWLVDNVTVTLTDFEFNTFELVIESDWEAAEAFKKNTSVTDF